MFFSFSFSCTSTNMVLGLKAEKLLVFIEKEETDLLKLSISFISCVSFSASIQKGGIIVIWAGDFRPTLQLNFSSMKFLCKRIFSFSSLGSTVAMKYIFTPAFSIGPIYDRLSLNL